MQLSPIRFWLINGGVLFYLLAPQPTAAQIVPDNTTLPNNSIVPPNCTNCEIRGGTTAGNNLFHSFKQFSIPRGGSAYFNNAPTIENIISRVTGNSASDIDGLIRANGKANLFLINPNGIIFGKNASLNIGGSFLATTADSIKFADGSEFSAVNPKAPALLKVSVPMGLQFGQTPGEIRNAGLLRVSTGNTLALVGGTLNLPGGRLGAAGGRVELGSVAGNNLVSLNPTNQGWVLGYEGIQNFQDISLSGEAFVSTRGDRGGDIQIQGRRVTLTEGSQVISIATKSQAGNVKLSASEVVELRSPSANSPTVLSNQVQNQATGEGGTLTIETKRLVIEGGAQVISLTSGTQPGVDVTVKASESVELAGNSPNGKLPSGLFARAGQTATGKGGTLTIDTKRLIIQGGAQVSTATFGAGGAGNLRVIASESVEVVGRIPDNKIGSGLFAQVEENATGDGGELYIETGRLTVLGGAQISTSARSGGQGGKLTINARDSILVSGFAPIEDPEDKNRSNILVSAERGATRDAGKLEINTGLLTVENGGRISADNFGTGKGGTATLNVRQLNIRNGGEVRAGSFGAGPGGQLIVNATDSVDVIGTGNIGGTTFPSTLFTQATGSGPAGDIQVQARTLKLNNQGRITAETASSDGGNITLNLRELLTLRNNSRISTSAGTAEAGGNGGNIKIDAPFIVSAPNNNSDITANAFEGRGGRVEIDATGIFYLVPRSREELVQLLGTPPLDPSRLTTNDITAISQQNPSLSGTVIINTPDVDPSRGLLQLPTEPENVQVAQGCQTGDNQSSIAFFNTGRGGLAPNPYEPLSQSNIWEDVSPPSQRTAAATSSDTIVEAQGWIINDKGEVVLVAEAPTPGFQSRCRLR